MEEMACIYGNNLTMLFGCAATLLYVARLSLIFSNRTSSTSSPCSAVEYLTGN